MTRAYSFLTIKSADDDSREISGIATTPTVDKVGDVVVPTGADFTLPLPLLWQHKHDQPIGHVTHARATPDGISFRAKLVSITDPGALKDRLDEAWLSLKTGLVRALSIGFVPTEYEPMRNGGMKFTRWLWSELSCVTIPANGDCTIQTIKAADAAARRAGYNQHRIVKLAPHEAPWLGKSARTVKLDGPAPGGSVVDAMVAEMDLVNADLDRLQEMKEIGPTNSLLVRSQAAGAKATDAALDEIRRRLAQIEGRNR